MKRTKKTKEVDFALVRSVDAWLNPPEKWFHYFCEHCNNLTLTSSGEWSGTLDCPRCGALTTFRLSTVPQSCELPPDHQCERHSRTDCNDRKLAVREFLLYNS